MMKQFPNSKLSPSNTETILEGIGLTIACLFIGGLAYLCLSIEFLHTFAVVVLVLVSVLLLVIAFFAIMIPYAAIQDLRSRQRPFFSSSTSEKRKIDPRTLIRVKAISKIRGIIDKHMETLARRRLMLVKIDHYGVVDGSEWNEEVQRFVDKVVRPELSEPEALVVAPIMNVLFQEMIEDRVRLRSDEIEAELDYSANFTPSQFEQWCAKTLNAKGWKAVTTKGSGDQGADVLADKDGIRIVLQCKHYNGTVGNKAVQEAYSAQRHYATNASAVVTNAEFSPAARELAGTTGVLLLHYGDLTRLDRLLLERNLKHNGSD